MTRPAGKSYTNTSEWRKVRAFVLECDGRICQIRGPKCKITANDVDHIIAVADGGALLDPSNLRAACVPCNNSRAQRQKSREGWRRSPTRIVLVVGPPAAGKADYVKERALPGDLVIDYNTIAASIGGAPHEMVRELRNALLVRVRRGETGAARVWITSTDPDAESNYPHHEVVVIDPGRDVVLERCPREFLQYAEEWYRRRAPAPETSRREW